MTLRPIQICLILTCLLIPTGSSLAQQNHENNTMPSIGDLFEVIDKVTTKDGEDKPAEWTTPVKLAVIFTILAILPSLIAMTTSFTRIVIVLGFARRALSTQSIPPTVAIMGLAIFLTLYTMAPTFYKINNDAIQPYLADEMEASEASAMSATIIKGFMLRQTRQSDLMLFIKIAKSNVPPSPTDLPIHIVVPSFIISEFRTAFEMGCLMFIPFLLLDLVVASILLSAGMMMLPPAMISLPLKLILFILVDGWGILAQSLSLSFK